MKIYMTLLRIYTNDIDSTIIFYEKLLSSQCSNRFEYKQAELELARVNDFLIIGGTDKALEPFRETSYTLLVDSIQEFRDFLMAHGATIVRDIQQVPTGYNMTVKHPDGCQIEYVEHFK